jgi:hypothetical protein
MARQPEAPQGRGNPTLSAQEILHGRGTKLNSTNGSPNQNGTLAFGHIPKKDQKRTDGCWFCDGQRKMTRSHVLLHCQSARLVAARTEAWEDRDPGGVRVLLAIRDGNEDCCVS